MILKGVYDQAICLFHNWHISIVSTSDQHIPSSWTDHILRDFIPPLITRCNKYWFNVQSCCVLLVLIYALMCYCSLAACDATHFGVNCSQICTCHINNTADCNDTTGSCSCKVGWSGTKCELGRLYHNRCSIRTQMFMLFYTLYWEIFNLKLFNLNC